MDELDILIERVSSPIRYDLYPHDMVIYKLMKDDRGLFWGYVKTQYITNLNERPSLPKIIRNSYLERRGPEGCWLEFNEQEYIEAVEREKRGGNG